MGDLSVETVREFRPWSRLPPEAVMQKALIGFALFLAGVAGPLAQASYYPPAGEWAHKSPAEVGMNAAKPNDAVEFMKWYET